MSEIIYGKNSVREALRNERKISKVYITNNDNEIISLCKKNNINYKLVDKNFIQKMTTGNHQGVVAEVEEYAYCKLEDIITEKKDSLILILDGLEDPHNLGAIIRTAEASGVDGIILPKNRSVKLSGVVAKVSTGAIEYVKVCEVVNLTRAIQTLKDNGYWVVGAERSDKSVVHSDLKYDFKTALVIGSEGKGISRLVKEECDYLVEIPMVGKINSLNASVSAGILVYEIRRQQR